MSDMYSALQKALTKATKPYVRAARFARGRQRDYLSEEQIERLNNRKEKEELIKPAAYAAMAKAYMLASANGTLPANARQIMYQARPLVLKATDGKCWKKSSYFTQTLLPDYQAEHPDETASWDVVYDARGHFAEPYMAEEIGIGTLEVRSYLNSWGVVAADPEIKINDFYPTLGPKNRYKFALFIEKEGFGPLLKRSEIARKYDLAIFSSKGQSTTATRQLVDAMSLAGVTILVLHDFDVSGFSIVHNLGHDTRRYSFESEPNVIDIGLRLTDVEAMSLQSEPVTLSQMKDPGEKLSEYGASEEEIAFLVRDFNRRSWEGQRVELNAMTSDQFIAWLEAKLKEHGVTKVVPDVDTLALAWQRADRVARIQAFVEEIEESTETPIAVPKGLTKKLKVFLKKNPKLSWDQALVHFHRNNGKERHLLEDDEVAG